MYGGMMMFPIDAAVDLLKAYRGFMEDAPDEICGGAAIRSEPPPSFIIRNRCPSGDTSYARPMPSDK